MSDVGSVEAGNPEAAAPAPAPVAEVAPVADAPFYSSFENEELRGFVENKGMKTSEQLATSYHNLEKLMGADKAGRTVVLPGPDADEASMSEFYGKLGRPETADAYDLPVPEGQDGSTAEWASGVFHKYGLTPAQARGVAEEYNGRIAEVGSAAEQTNTQTEAEATSELRRDWGAAYDQKVAGIETTAVALGIQHEQLLGLRDSMGPAAAMKFVDQLASKLGEDTIVNGESVDAVMTPNNAAAAIQAMWGDPETHKALMERNHPQHQIMLDKKSSLSKLVAAGRG
tara:strand:- start:1406 stop:2260 length:855 start_codon:yes stop_codon:yes gene_type:complete